jgi:hypothetical protein
LAESVPQRKRGADGYSGDMTRTAMALGAAVLAAAACRVEGGGEGARSARKYAALEAASEAPLDESLRRFEETASAPDAAARLEAARRALEEARKLREVLETGRAPAGLEYASGEELVYANHLVDGLAAFVQSDGGPAALETLRSVLTRGFIHRDRGRSALR